ncbi:ribonuclease HI [Candidatus Legionella polyplacis]|uniref:Ribonuclease H n=1 Tax=Candidatus Legionella polyplacis TaxID=2005262 RepID=A0ABZ2GY60_9GAMM
MIVKVYTDGACKGNPGPGGWGFLLRYCNYTKFFYGFDPLTTNNRMELTAAIKALESLNRSCNVHLFTDSKYLSQGMNNWIFRWKKNFWVNTKKKPIKNIDLWKKLDLISNFHVVNWYWIKGHSGYPENEQVDALAKKAILESLC